MQILILVFFLADQVEQTPIASSEMRSVVSDVSLLSFVSDATVPQLTLASTADFNQVEEYESDLVDSDNDVDIEPEELVIGKLIMRRQEDKFWLCVLDEPIIHSKRDSVRKAQEAHLINKAQTLHPFGINKRDEARQ